MCLCAGRGGGRDDENMMSRRPRDPWDEGSELRCIVCLSVCLSVAGSVAEWLACWTQAQKGLGSNRSHDAVA